LPPFASELELDLVKGQLILEHSDIIYTLEYFHTDKKTIFVAVEL
jgi:hypothetical protein